MAENQTEFLTFRGKPLVRMGNMVYYGDPGEKFVVMLQVLSSEDFKGVKLSKKIIVQLMLTDPDVKATETIVRRAEREGMYQAMDLADIWLERAISDSKKIAAATASHK